LFDLPLRSGKRGGEVAVVPVAHQPSSLQKVRPAWTARRSIARLLPATADDNGGGKSSQASLPKGHRAMRRATLEEIERQQSSTRSNSRNSICGWHQGAGRLINSIHSI